MSKKPEKGVEMLLVSFVRVSESTTGIHNYKVVVSVNQEVLYRGSVLGHPQALGWQRLVATFAEQVKAEEENDPLLR